MEARARTGAGVEIMAGIGARVWWMAGAGLGLVS